MDIARSPPKGTFISLPQALADIGPKLEDQPVQATDGPIEWPEEEAAFITQIALKKKLDKATIFKALYLIKNLHRGQKRTSGGPFYLHPVAVAQILLGSSDRDDRGRPLARGGRR